MISRGDSALPTFAQTKPKSPLKPSIGKRAGPLNDSWGPKSGRHELGHHWDVSDGLNKKEKNKAEG